MKKIDFLHLTQVIEEHMAIDQADGRVGGAGIAVWQNGEPKYEAYFGKVSYQNEGSPQPNQTTRFRLASMTKPITAAAVMVQVEKGLLELDAPITQWLPSFSDLHCAHLTEKNEIIPDKPAYTPITVRMLLNHTSGIGTMELGNRQYVQMPVCNRYSIARVTDYFSKEALAFEPGSAQAYSPFVAFDVAARLVEITSDMPYDRFCAENLFLPCGMLDTTFTPSEIRYDAFVSMHNRVENGNKGVSTDVPMPANCVFEDFPDSWFCAGAGLSSTLPDYVRFAEMLCHDGVSENGTRILAESSVRAMRTPCVPVSIMPGPMRWGLGMRVITEAYHMPLGCYGWSGAYGSHFWVDPENQITAVYMKNSRYDGGAGCQTSIQLEKDVYESL